MQLLEITRYVSNHLERQGDKYIINTFLADWPQTTLGISLVNASVIIIKQVKPNEFTRPLHPNCTPLWSSIFAGMVRGALVGTSIATITIQVSSNVLYELVHPKVSSIDWEAKEMNKVGSLTFVESLSNMLIL